MTKTAIAIAAMVLSVLTLVIPANTVSAQSPGITTGVVTAIETDDNGGLTAFSIVEGDGKVTRFTVSAANPNTAYGLENRVGNRWVSDQSSDAQEAATRLRDQQKRLTTITVQSDGGGVASSVVQAVSADVDTNLGYLLAVAAITWIGIMAYVIYMSTRQRSLSSELSRLKESQSDDQA